MRLTELPYNGTEGYARGSETSRDRAMREAATGVATERQKLVLELLDKAPSGLTWSEAGRLLGLHHGQISGTLSVLHRAGKIVQLKRKRGNSAPYLSMRFVELYHPAEVRFLTTSTSAGDRRRALEKVAEAARALAANYTLITQAEMIEALRELDAIKTRT